MASALRALTHDAAPKAFLPVIAARLVIPLHSTAPQPAGAIHKCDTISSESVPGRGAEARRYEKDCESERLTQPPLPRGDEQRAAIGLRYDLGRYVGSDRRLSIGQSRGLVPCNGVTSSNLGALRLFSSHVLPSHNLTSVHVALLHSSATAHVTSGGGDSRGSSEGASESAASSHPHTSSATGAAGSQGGHEVHSAHSSGAAAAAGGSAGSSSSSSSSGGSSGSGKDGEAVKAAVLQAALTHVPTLGWSSAALIAGARDNGLSPSVLGMLPRGEAHLVEFFMDRCRRQFEAEFPHTPIAVATAAPGHSPHSHSHSHSSSSGGQACGGRYEEGDALALQSRMAAAIRTRLRLQAPYTSSWAQALAIQARPSNACESLRQRRQLAASMWSAVGVRCSDAQLLAYRVLLGSAYAAAEVHMLTDFSPDFHDTWRFVDREMQAAFQIQGSADRLVAQACDSIPAIKTVLSILSKPPSTRQA